MPEQQHTPAAGELPPLFRPKDLEAQGFSRHLLRGMVRRGEAERVTRGLYRLTSAPLSEHESLAAVSKLVPHAVVCLLSALSFHALGTQAPPQVWIGIDRKARRPKVGGLKLRVVRFNETMKRYGVEAHEILGAEVRVTGPARTVVDCFRFVDKVGLDVALEALKDAIYTRHASVSEIQRAAEVMRVDEQMRPYLEAILA
jgi:predicted transcriptional regulator of viral defense system